MSCEEVAEQGRKIHIFKVEPYRILEEAPVTNNKEYIEWVTGGPYDAGLERRREALYRLLTKGRRV